MTDDTRNQRSPLDDAGIEPLDPRVLAFARALGRYQALRDMAAARASGQDADFDADLRAWPSAPAKRGVIDHYSLGERPAFLPGFLAYAAAPHPAFHLG